MTPADSMRLLKASMRVEGAVAERNRLIRLAHSEGASLREIAAATTTLTHSGINRIIQRPSDDERRLSKVANAMMDTGS